MEVTYQLEREDYWRFQQFFVRRVPALRRQILATRLFLPVLCALVFWTYHLPLGNYILLLLILSAGWLLFTFRVQKRTTMAMVEARPGAIGLHTMRLDSNGLREQSTVMEAFVLWGNVTEITESPQALAFFLGPQFGFMVPKRAFADPEQAQAFLQTARAYREGLAAGTAPVLPPS